MFGTIRNDYSNSPSANADTNSSRSQNLRTARGAILLLAFTLLAVSTGVVVRRASLADQAPLPQTTIVDNTVQASKLLIDEGDEQGIYMETEEQTQPIATSNTTTSIQVNGESIDLPPSGNSSIYKEVVSEDGSVTTIDIDMNSSTIGSSTGSSSSTLRLDVQSSQVSESETE